MGVVGAMLTGTGPVVDTAASYVGSSYTGGGPLGASVDISSSFLCGPTTPLREERGLPTANRHRKHVYTAEADAIPAMLGKKNQRTKREIFIRPTHWSADQYVDHDVDQHVDPTGHWDSGHSGGVGVWSYTFWHGAICWSITEGQRES